MELPLAQVDHYYGYILDTHFKHQTSTYKDFLVSQPAAEQHDLPFFDAFMSNSWYLH